MAKIELDLSTDELRMFRNLLPANPNKLRSGRVAIGDGTHGNGAFKALCWKLVKAVETAARQP